MSTYAETAARLAAQFETAKRDDGTEFVRRKDDAPDSDALRDMVFAADSCGMSMDTAYQFVWEVLQQIADTEPDDLSETELPESDVYTYSLWQWIAENPGYLDAVREEYGSWDGIADTADYLAMAAQQIAYREVLDAIIEHWPDESDDDDEPEASPMA